MFVIFPFAVEIYQDLKREANQTSALFKTEQPLRTSTVAKVKIIFDQFSIVTVALPGRITHDIVGKDPSDNSTFPSPSITTCDVVPAVLIV